MIPNAVRQLHDRLSDYNFWEVAIELALIWVLVYLGYRFVRGTRAAGAFKGVLVLLIISSVGFRLLEQSGVLPRLSSLYDKFLGLGAFALLVIFQPELRRALIRLGENPFFRGASTEVRPVIDAIVEASTFLSKSKFGAIIAVERSVGLREMADSGTTLNSEISPKLLTTIFHPNTALHDMGVVIRGSKIVAAGVQFPLAEPGDMVDPHLGTRHRAAVGLARVSDAIVIVVSEETGAVSLAEGQELRRWLDPEQLRAELVRRMGKPAAVSGTAMEEAEKQGGLSGELDEEPEQVSSTSRSVKTESERKAAGQIISPEHTHG
ncbi:MAG: diadenylate cyclase CdaA [Phycisphaerales bacterium JB065]